MRFNLSWFKCTLGFHSWKRKRSFSQFSSNVIELTEECEHCKGLRHRIVPKKG